MQLSLKRWFEIAQTDLAHSHKSACERSIKKKGCSKVFDGAYYYKGFYLYRNGNKHMGWSWNTIDDRFTMRASTKKECIEYIECHINHNKIYEELTI